VAKAISFAQHSTRQLKLTAKDIFVTQLTFIKVKNLPPFKKETGFFITLLFGKLHGIIVLLDNRILTRIYL